MYHSLELNFDTVNTELKPDQKAIRSIGRAKLEHKHLVLRHDQSLAFLYIPRYANFTLVVTFVTEQGYTRWRFAEEIKRLCVKLSLAETFFILGNAELAHEKGCFSCRET